MLFSSRLEVWDWSESECSRFNGSENIVGVDGASV